MSNKIASLIIYSSFFIYCYSFIYSAMHQWSLNYIKVVMQLSALAVAIYWGLHLYKIWGLHLHEGWTFSNAYSKSIIIIAVEILLLTWSCFTPPRFILWTGFTVHFLCLLFILVLFVFVFPMNRLW